jgi:hypothetical protein
MLRHISLKRLFIVSWLIAFGVLYVLMFLRRLGPGDVWEPDWRFAAISAVGVAGLITLIVKRLQDEPTKEERESFWALFNSKPGVVGVVLVTKNGVPEVIATVRSREEYLHLAGSGQLPVDHKLFIAEDA